VSAPPPSTPSAHDARAALGAFVDAPAEATLRPHTTGLINHAWLVEAAVAGRPRRFLLQQVNRHVFRTPAHVLENMARITSHLDARLEREGARDRSRRVLRLIATRDGAPSWLDARGETWRLLPWIEGARFLERASSAWEARETARAFGEYARQLADLPAPALHETIPGFHDTRARLAAFERHAAADRVSRASGCRREVDALLDRRALAQALPCTRDAATEALRPVHNDAKVANVLFDEESGRALAVVDLDTTMPGLLAHDFGDMVRTGISDSAEDERELSRVRVRGELFEALAAGYLDGLGEAVSMREREALLTGALVIVYEQALRFLADHLDGDRYYRIARPGHNLDRARAQLALLEALEQAAPGLEQVIASLAGA
jgi:Ser/Thr protein kinase RdoA (MazF antagonist)